MVVGAILTTVSLIIMNSLLPNILTPPSEYLIKQYLQTAQQEPIYSDMWQEALAGIEQHLIIPSKSARLKFVAELPHGIGGPLSPKMDHLVCFLPGAIALGATGGRTETAARNAPGWTQRKSEEMRLARELMKTCWGMYKVTQTGLAPEIVWFEADDADLQPHHHVPKQSSKDVLPLWEQDYQIRVADAHNLQRPETVESLFVMWRITEDSKYREWGWKIFQAFREHTSVPLHGGFTSLHNVNQIPAPQRDNMESFWLVGIPRPTAA